MEGAIQGSLFNTVRLVSGAGRERTSQDAARATMGVETQVREEHVRWTTKEAVAACAWSALFGLGCGYGWLFFHLSANACR